MRKSWLITASLMATLAASAASAAVIYTTSSATGAGGTAMDPGAGAGYTPVLTFNAGAPGYTAAPGVTLTFQGAANIDTGTNSTAAAPAGDTGYYAAAEPGDSFTVNLSGYLANHPGTSSVSFYWGSADSYNTLNLLNSSGTVIDSLSGASLPADNGNQTSPNTNFRIFLNTAAEIGFAQLQFVSTNPAFEVADVSVAGGGGTIGGGAGVPEPAAWALMIVGMGLVGGQMRRKTLALDHA